MTDGQVRDLLALAARADVLGELRKKNRISEEEYIVRLNELRQRAGLGPIQLRQRERPANARARWGGLMCKTT